MPLKTFFSSLFHYLQAFKFLAKNKLWHLVLLPGLFSLLLVMALVVSGFAYSADLSSFLTSKLFSFENNNAFVEFLIQVFVTIIIIVLGLLIYRPLALVLLSPFLSLLSEKTEKIILNQNKLVASGSFFKDLYRSIRINGRYFLFSSLYSLGAVATGLLPVVGAFISTLLLFLIQSYYGGGGLADIILERRGLSVNQRLQFLKENRSLITGSGAGFLLILLIPFIGWFIAPGIGTIATTIALTKPQSQSL